MKIKELFCVIEHEASGAESCAIFPSVNMEDGAALPVARAACGAVDAEVGGVAIDSRLVKPGDLFVATVGREADGHDYLQQALRSGAAAVLICDSHREKVLPLTREHEDVCFISVNDTRAVLSAVVNRFYGEPSRNFTLVGITGTNGKTSTAVMAEHIFRSAPRRARGNCEETCNPARSEAKSQDPPNTENTEGRCFCGQNRTQKHRPSVFKTGLLGTIDNLIGGEPLDIKLTTPTTPDCVELGAIMRRMADAGVDVLIMEVSSMGLKMGRVSACDFDIGVFTNISPEHLDDHGTFEDYLESKLILMGMVKKAVINMDDKYAASFESHATGTVFGYGIIHTDKCSLYGENIEYSADGVRFDMVYRCDRGTPRDRGTCNLSHSLECDKLHVPLSRPEGGEIDVGVHSCSEIVRACVRLSTPAEFAVYNALAAAGACICAGVDFGTVVNALNENIHIAGRYQVLTSADGVYAIVDYAHTDKALENLLTAVRGNPVYHRVISVFGCGGDRDPSKRAPMGRTSGELADYTYVTSDNPRTEDPLAIISQVEVGVKSSGGSFETVPDRKCAIEKAIADAAPGDVVIIAGKGHEDYQIIGKEKIHLDDREIADESLRRRTSANGGR